MYTHVKITLIPNIWVFFSCDRHSSNAARVLLSACRGHGNPFPKETKGKEGSTGPMKAKKGLKQVLRESFGAFTRKVDHESYKT